jgi:hypothetical protein
VKQKLAPTCSGNNAVECVPVKGGSRRKDPKNEVFPKGQRFISRGATERAGRGRDIRAAA